MKRVMVLPVGLMLFGCQTVDEASLDSASAKGASPTGPQVIEWETGGESFVIPPAEVKEQITARCKEIGHDEGVIVSMKWVDSKISANFDCRGDGAS